MSIAIAGTHTNIGKTFLSASILGKYSRKKKLFYWKPIQTGSMTDSDTNFILDYSRMETEFILPPEYIFRYPSSPDYAASLEDCKISFESVISRHKEHNKFVSIAGGRLIVELAGGVYVPWNELFTSLDFLQVSQVPVLLAVSRELGTINHTLLTIEACKNRGIPVLGFVGFSFRSINEEIWESSVRSIERFSQVPCLGSYSIEKHMTPEDFLSWCEDDFDPEGRLETVLSSL